MENLGLRLRERTLRPSSTARCHLHRDAPGLSYACPLLPLPRFPCRGWAGMVQEGVYTRTRLSVGRDQSGVHGEASRAAPSGVCWFLQTIRVA